MNQRLSMSFAAAAAFATALPAQAVECFSIYDARNTLVYQTSTAPIDLSRPIEDQMARRFPARYLVISDATPCGQGDASAATARGAATLLSNVGDNARPSGTVDDAADPYAAPPLPMEGTTGTTTTRTRSRSSTVRR